LAEIAEQAGADALLSVTPYYNKASERGLVAHYTAIADRVERPLLLYNVPSRTGVSMTPEVYRELARHPNIVGIKEASGDLLLTESVVGELSDRMDVYTGNDHQFTAALKLGCTGVISVYSNLFPCEMLEIWRAWCNGDAAGASRRQRQLRPYLDAMFCEVNPIPVKYVASLLGICQAEYRLPLCPPSAETARALKKLFAEKLPAP
jgi:4-hydroxy-tetrahydrodipicolinate synthase